MQADKYRLQSRNLHLFRFPRPQGVHGINGSFYDPSIFPFFPLPAPLLPFGTASRTSVVFPFGPLSTGRWILVAIITRGHRESVQSSANIRLDKGTVRYLKVGIISEEARTKTDSIAVISFLSRSTF